MGEGIDLSILLLAKNEAGNLEILIPEVRSIADRSALKYELLLVDAGSGDGSEQVCRKNGVRFLVQSKPGFGVALAEGLRACTGKRILTMDCDLQHDPKAIPTMLKTDADVVIGSRWAGGNAAHVSTTRMILSLATNAVFSKLLMIHIRDMSSNFRLYKRQALQGIRIEATNFDALEEVLVKCVIRGCTVVEVPITFRKRGMGVSNVTLSKFLVSFAATFIKAAKIRVTQGSASPRLRR
jgi:glycosyltransferase involved in cell wall biosynthesis